MIFFKQEIIRQREFYSSLDKNSLISLHDKCSNMCKYKSDCHWLEYCVHAKMIKEILDSKDSD